MKRLFPIALVIGLIAAAIVIALHVSGVLFHLELGTSRIISPDRAPAGLTGIIWQSSLIILLAVGISWLTLTSLRRGRIGWLVLVLLLELAALSWICALYQVLFQPLPFMVAGALAYLASEGWILLSRRTRSHLVRAFFADHLSKKQTRRMMEGEIPLDPTPRTYEATVVVCDIANKYDLAEESDPAAFAETTEAFIRRTTDLLLEEDGYIQAADGEGVVAIFGFPDGNIDHADKAVRVTLGLLGAFQQTRQQNNGDLFGKCDLHIGVSSGTLIVAPLKNGERPGLLTTGEPVELARRFCVANRFYGSHILIGPRTFELASKHIVARPIDFLSGVNSQERHEIYEPLWLAAEAKPEHIARRDFFWNGVVLYREKRWAEAYNEFQKARGPDGDDDAPLQLYLRRLETLALHLTTAPDGG